MPAAEEQGSRSARAEPFGPMAYSESPMETAAGPPTTQAEPMSNARAFALHLWAFVLPLITLSFWLTGPHSWWASLLWTTPLFVLVYADNHAPNDKRQPREDIPGWPFD